MDGRRDEVPRHFGARCRASNSGSWTCRGGSARFAGLYPQWVLRFSGRKQPRYKN